MARARLCCSVTSGGQLICCRVVCLSYCQTGVTSLYSQNSFAVRNCGLNRVQLMGHNRDFFPKHKMLFIFIMNLPSGDIKVVLVLKLSSGWVLVYFQPQSYQVCNIWFILGCWSHQVGKTWFILSIEVTKRVISDSCSESWSYQVDNTSDSLRSDYLSSCLTTATCSSICSALRWDRSNCAACAVTYEVIHYHLSAI